MAARWVLEAQAGASADTVAEELEAGADFHFVVHNAAGMISVQQGISVTDALIRLRAYAFAAIARSPRWPRTWLTASSGWNDPGARARGGVSR